MLQLRPWSLPYAASPGGEGLWRDLGYGMRCAVGKRGSAVCWPTPVKGGAHRGWTSGQLVPTLSGGEYPEDRVYDTGLGAARRPPA